MVLARCVNKNEKHTVFSNKNKNTYIPPSNIPPNDDIPIPEPPLPLPNPLQTPKKTEQAAEVGRERERVRDYVRAVKEEGGIEGLGGWIHYTLLSGIRYVLVKDELLEMRLLPSSDAQVIARVPQHNIATLDKCNLDWCRIVDDGYKGWVLKSGIWGVYKHEITD